MTTDKTIPKSTPFELTGTATDANSGDVLSYSWEGTNVGTVTPVDATFADDSKPPFFRSYAPVASATRYYPRLSAILDGTNKAKGDKLPSIGIVTKHRFTVRDNKDGVNYGEMNVTIDNGSGPFLITSNLAGTYASGSAQTVTWSVANTTAAPVSAPTVDILLSTDGGQTFTTTLLAAAANNGSASVNLPYLATTTTTARIKVKASNNIFFDISNSNFTINSGTNPLPLYLVNIQATKQASNVAVMWNTVAESNLIQYQVEYSSDAVNFKQIGSVNARNTAGPNDYNFVHTAPGKGTNYYRLKIVSATGNDKYSPVVSIKNTTSEISIISIYPNPLKGGKLGIQFNNVAAETFAVKLYSVIGQQLLERTIKHTGGTADIKIDLNIAKIAAGTYQLILSGSNGTQFHQKLVIQ